MRKVRDVLRLKHTLGMSLRQISEATGVGKTVVGEYDRPLATFLVTGLDSVEEFLLNLLIVHRLPTCAQVPRAPPRGSLQTGVPTHPPAGAGRS